MKILGHVSSHMGPVQGITEWTDFVWSLYLPPKWLYLNLDWKILNNPPSTGFVCFTNANLCNFSKEILCFYRSMKLPRTFTIFRTLLRFCLLTWTVTWTRFLSASRWVEADNDPNNSHIQPQQLSTGYRLYSLTMTICPGLEPIRRAASGEPCLVHRLQWNLPVSHPSRLVQGIYLTLHITFSQFKDLISHGKYFQWWLLYFT